MLPKILLRYSFRISSSLNPSCGCFYFCRMGEDLFSWRFTFLTSKEGKLSSSFYLSRTLGVMSSSLNYTFCAKSIIFYRCSRSCSSALFLFSSCFEDWFLTGKKNFLEFGIFFGEQLIRIGSCGAMGRLLRDICWEEELGSMILLSEKIALIDKIN